MKQEYLINCRDHQTLSETIRVMTNGGWNLVSQKQEPIEDGHYWPFTWHLVFEKIGEADIGYEKKGEEAEDKYEIKYLSDYMFDHIVYNYEDMGELAKYLEQGWDIVDQTISHRNRRVTIRKKISGK